MSIDVVIADDHALIRAGLIELLNTIPDVNVVGEAGDGLMAIDKVAELEPDIILLDISMPKMRGLEAISEIKRISPCTRVLILSMYDNREYIRESFKNGASGYLLKDAATDELKSAIHTLMSDKIYISPEHSQFIVREWVVGKGENTPEISSDNLTEREKSVLKLLAEGNTNKQVAELLHISSKTVETHRSRIMEKLNIDNFAALVKYAIRSQIVEL